MSSKLDYLRKYLSADQSDADAGKKKKRRKKIKKKISNVVIHDDDVDWRTIAPKMDEHSEEEEDDPESAPVVAEFKDDAAPIKWRVVRSTKSPRPPSLPRDLPEDSSPPRKTIRRRHDSPDLRPTREKFEKLSHDLSDSSPPQRNARMRHDSPDGSPPRRNTRVRHDSPDASPHRRNVRMRHDSPDASPPRRTRHDSPDSDLSPPRLRAQDQDLSPPRRRDTPDLSPPRCGPINDSDLSPPRKRVAAQDSPDLSPPRRREQHVDTLGTLESGRTAKTVYRDKSGRQIDLAVEAAKRKAEERAKMEEDDKFAEWGRGLVQVQSMSEQLREDLAVMAKPLARHRDDEDLERLLKEREREGDPMLAFLRKKKSTTDPTTGKKRKARPTYQGAFAPNRFGIRPGYRWDGIDRSNGFERSLVVRKAEQKSLEETAYKWSTEDM